MPKSLKGINSGAPQVLEVKSSYTDWSVTVEATPGSTGIVTVKYKRVGVSQRNFLATVNLSLLSEPFTANFSGRMDDFEFSATSLVGSYSVTADGLNSVSDGE